MPRETRPNADYLYFCRITHTYALPDGSTNEWKRVYGPYDLPNPARAIYNRGFRELEQDIKNGRVGPNTPRLYDGRVNIKRTVEMLRTKIVLEEESMW